MPCCAKKWHFKSIKLIFLNGNDCWISLTKFPWKVFLRKYFAPVLKQEKQLNKKNTFLDGHKCWTTSTRFPWKNISQKIFCPCFYCLKCFTELKHIFKQENSFFWVFTIVQQLQQNFHEKSFVRKYFVPFLFVRNVFPSCKMKFFGDKVYFTGWSRLLKIFIDIATLQSRPEFLFR